MMRRVIREPEGSRKRKSEAMSSEIPSPGAIRKTRLREFFCCGKIYFFLAAVGSELVTASLVTSSVLSTSVLGFLAPHNSRISRIFLSICSIRFIMRANSLCVSASLRVVFASTDVYATAPVKTSESPVITTAVQIFATPRDAWSVWWSRT